MNSRAKLRRNTRHFRKRRKASENIKYAAALGLPIYAIGKNPHTSRQFLY